MAWATHLHDQPLMLRSGLAVLHRCICRRLELLDQAVVDDEVGAVHLCARERTYGCVSKHSLKAWALPRQPCLVRTDGRTQA